VRSEKWEDMLKIQAYRCIALNGQVKDVYEMTPDVSVADVSSRGCKRTHQK
jgi:hypothetical protein